MEPLKLFLLLVAAMVMFDLAVQHVVKSVFKKKFKTSHPYHTLSKIGILSVPLLGLAVLVWNADWGYVRLFMASAVIGTLLEYLLGVFLKHIRGSEVWTYHFLPLGRYTSWISIPYWGGAGLVFFYIATKVV